MKRIVLTLLAIIVTVSSAGCVKEGPSPIYTEQNSAILNEQNPASPFEKYQVPDHWSDNLAKDDLTVIVDAVIAVPEFSQFQSTVIGRDDISQETADRIRTVLLGDAVLYLDEPPTYPYTKPEIQEQIDGTLAYMETPEAVGDLLTSSQKRIKSLEDMYSKAPESFEPGPADTQFQKIEHLDGSTNYMVEEILGTAILADGREARLKINKRYEYSGAEARFYSEPYDPQDSSWDAVMHNPPPFIDAGITKEQAREKAISAVRDMGLDYLGVSSIEEYRIIERSDDGMPTALRPCYKFYLMRNIGDITANYAVPPNTKFTVGGYSAEKTPIVETATIIIAKEGIIEFVWGEPTKIVRTENENLKLLNFNDIQAVFNTQIIMDNLDSELGISMEIQGVAVSDRKITITEVRLGLMGVMWQGHEGECLMIPVWDFYGHESFTALDPGDAVRKQVSVNGNGEVASNLPGAFGKSYLTLNAVDGSVINRWLGY